MKQNSSGFTSVRSPEHLPFRKKNHLDRTSCLRKSSILAVHIFADTSAINHHYVRGHSSHSVSAWTMTVIAPVRRIVDTTLRPVHCVGTSRDVIAHLGKIWIHLHLDSIFTLTYYEPRCLHTMVSIIARSRSCRVQSHSGCTMGGLIDPRLPLARKSLQQPREAAMVAESQPFAKEPRGGISTLTMRLGSAESAEKAANAARLSRHIIGSYLEKDSLIPHHVSWSPASIS